MKRKTTKRVAKKKGRRRTAVAKRRTAARPKRKPARKPRRVKRKASPKRSSGVRQRKKRTAKPARARARRTKPKAAKRAKTAASKRAATTKRPTTRTTAPPGASLERTGLARATRLGAAPVAPLPQPQPGSVEALVPLVEDELRGRGDDAPDPEVVRTLATAGSGYRKGPGADPPFPIPVDIDERVAEGFVERYWVGDRSGDPDLEGERRTTARQWVRFTLDQAGPAGATPTVVATLAAVALGSWKPNQDPLALLNVYADAVAGYYGAGLS